jgi:hypothetical protein
MNRLAGTWASLPKSDGSAPYQGQRTHVRTDQVRDAIAARPASPADAMTSANPALRTGPTNATADTAVQQMMRSQEAAAAQGQRAEALPEARALEPTAPLEMARAPVAQPATDMVMQSVQAVDSTPNYDQFPKPPKQDAEPTQNRGAVGGTPLPADERERGMKVPGSPTQQQVTLAANLNIAPIRVEHTSGSTGEVLGTEYYPVTKVDSARALGTVA